MRLGGPIFQNKEDPQGYVAEHLKKGYRAGYCPAGLTVADTVKIGQYREACKAGDLLIAEVGVWCNPMSLDVAEAKKNIDYSIERLAFAEELQAKTCVNIIGTRYADSWYGPCAENFSEDFFAHAVDVSRQIIDAVNPKYTTMSFELFAFNFLDSAEEYVRFLQAVDRKQAAMHFDPTNCINSVRALYQQKALFSQTFDLLGDRMVSVHIKDIKLNPEPFSVMLDEVPMGTGDIDEVWLLQQLAKMPADLPVLLEHLPDEATFDSAAAAVRGLAEQAGVSL